MCGRVVFTGVTDDVLHLFRVGHVSESVPEPSWNIPPTRQIPLVLESPREPGRRRLEGARWGLTPPSSPTLTTPFPTFNARIESVTEKPTFAPPLRERRCAILVDGYYEWHGEGAERGPSYFRLPGEPMALAGLTGWWQDPAQPEQWHLTATMLTTAATGALAEVHHRMPVFLSAEDRDDWLSPAVPGDRGLLDRLARSAPTEAARVRFFPVRPLRGDGPELIAPRQPDGGPGVA
ncbi:SOS response-associated peptidase [Leucobacter sp. M11]|uniref:SOS response-associated peptidase n=1 Tax=Leucobacter sp. M11 TaxID=2993565 RepID=UPI002D804418|nr:SOS response-associated peptidase [Leucobacter sp. M11]MEB4615258.1 SOS response-associated peptidase [Leucobacter sp. M11]